MPREKKSVEDGLKNKGFKLKEGNHHRFIYYTINGKKSPVITKTSHTPKMKEIPDNLIGQMAKQCKLSKSDFLNLVDCPLSREAYEDILKKEGEI
jgi:hypothetical protein